MNRHVAAPDFDAPQVTTGPLPASRKVYVIPQAAPAMRVPVREIELSHAAGEPPLPVYDTSGPYSDPEVRIDVSSGLEPLRASWIEARGGVEAYEGRTIKPEDNSNAGERLAREFPHRCAPLRPPARPTMNCLGKNANSSASRRPTDCHSRAFASWI